MNTRSRATSTRVKQRVVITTVENVISTETNRHVKAVYGDDTVDGSTVNRRGRELGKAVTDDEERSGRPDDKR